MHNIYSCVDSFTSLLNVQYHFILGRKGTSVSLKIRFDKKDCFQNTNIYIFLSKSSTDTYFCRFFSLNQSEHTTKTSPHGLFFIKKKQMSLRVIPLCCLTSSNKIPLFPSLFAQFSCR